jgi:hypothetical protein
MWFLCDEMMCVLYVFVAEMCDVVLAQISILPLFHTYSFTAFSKHHSKMIRGPAFYRNLLRRHQSSKVFASAKEAVADIPNGAKLYCYSTFTDRNR